MDQAIAGGATSDRERPSREEVWSISDASIADRTALHHMQASGDRFTEWKPEED